MTIAPEQTLTESPRARRGWITPVLSIVGTLALVIALGAAVVGGVRLFLGGETVKSASVAGIDTLDVRASAASFRLEYANVSEATLRVAGAGDWTLERHGESLVVRSPERWFGTWFGPDEQAVLTLPAGLRAARLDAFLSLSAGELVARGDFGLLDLQVSAGDARVEGAARTVNVRVSAGQAEVTLADVEDAQLGVSAGWLGVTLVGSAPHDIAVEVTAGEAELRVPDLPYALTSDVTAGSFDYDVVVDSRSSHRIAVRVSAGQVVLLPARR